MARPKERDIQRKIALRSRRRKLKNRDLSVRDRKLDEARDMVRTLTRLRNRALLDGGGGRSNQNQHESTENVQPKKRRKRRKEVDLSSRRLTRSMDGETQQNSTEGGGRKIPTRLSLSKAMSVDCSGPSEFLSEDLRKRKRMKKENVIGKQAGRRVDVAASANRRGLAVYNRGARLKMARRSLKGVSSFHTSRSFSSSRGRSGKSPHHVPTEQALMKEKERQARPTGLESLDVEGVQGPTIQVNRGRRRKEGHKFQESRSRKRIARNTDAASASLNADNFQSTQNSGINRQLATTESPTVAVASAKQTGSHRRKRKHLESRDAMGPVTRGRMYRDLHDSGQKGQEEHISKADNASDGEGAGVNLYGPSTGKSNREHKQKKRSGNVELIPILTRSKRNTAANGLHNGEAGHGTGHHEKGLLLHEIGYAKNENDIDASRRRRNSRRKNTADCSDAGDQEIAQEIHIPKSTKGALKEKNTLVSVQDDAHTKPVLKDGHASVLAMRCTEGNVEAESLASAPMLALGHDGVASRDEACKVDLTKNCCLVATVSKGTGGRQMRPRPLDLEQPMPIVIEGCDQDNEDNDGGSFNISSQEPKDMEKEHKILKAGSWGTSLDLAAAGGKGKPILIPSYRVVPDFEQEPSSRPVYTMPKTYIKASTWAANDRKHQAEYDVDGEDVDWINHHNKTCHPGHLISVDQFEKIIDLLENKAADLDRSNLLSTDFGQDNESEDCCICNGGENSCHNLIFRCATCHIYVHQSCYGIQVSGVHAKDRKWHCRKCEAVAKGMIDSEVRCALCCKQGGALKPATEPQKWVHVVCALYTNETFFVNPDAMEPIDGVSAADARAKKQRRRCWLCGMKEGSSERCSVQTCRAVFHVSCGVRQGASFEVQHFNQQIVYVRPFCPKHATTAPVSSALAQESTSIDETNIEDNRKNVVRRRGRRKSWRRRRAARKGASTLENVTEGRASDEADEKRMGISDGTEPPLPNGISNTTLNLSENLLQKSIDEPYAILSLEDLPETNVATRDLVQEVYWYWLSKRERFGGPLLHHIQQELAAEYFGIFNPSGGDGDATSSMFHGRGFRHSFSMKQKLLAMRLQLQRLHELNDLVIKRERLKLDLYIIEQDIAKLGFQALVARGKDAIGPRGRKCFVCKEAYRLVQCALCSKGFCFRCFKSMTGAGTHNWLTALKRPVFACSECLKEKSEATEKPPPDSGDDCINCEDDPLHHVDHTDGGQSNGCITTLVKEDEGLKNDLEDGASPSTEVPERKVNILLPHSGLQQDKAATQAFWESFEQQSNPKTVLVSQLLKNMFHKLREDVPKKLAKIHRRN